MSKKRTSSVQNRVDGWSNVLTGLGRAQFEKMSNAQAKFEPIAWEDAEELYGSDDIAAKIVDELPDEAFREGFELTIEGDDKKLIKDLMAEMQRVDLMAKLMEAWKWARLYGGSGILPLTNEMDMLNKPLNLKALLEIKGFVVLSAPELIGQAVDSDLSSKNFSFPRRYLISPRGIGGADTNLQSVHYTRVMRFSGVPLPRRLFIQRRYWDDSVLTRIQTAIRNYSVAHLAAANLIDDLSVAVYKIKNLNEAIAGGDDSAVLKRMQLMNLTRSISRAMIADAEGEDLTYQTRSVTGVPELLKSIGNRLVAASNMPHTRLLGESPEGSQATGNSTTTQWYDFVANRQENYLKPRLLQCLTLLCLAKKGPTGGKVPEGLDIIFKPLWQMDETDAADVRFKQSQADANYMDRGALDPEEVAMSRWGSGKYSTETKIDPKLRRQLVPDQKAKDPKKDDPKNGKSGK